MIDLTRILDYLYSEFQMSLGYLIINGFELDSEFYKCPENMTNAIHSRRPYWGVWFFTSGLVILFFYTICLIAIATSDMMKTAAYKTMFVLGIYDISSTFIHSIATGILGFKGLSFCNYPRLIFTLGSIGLGSWMGCCITSVVLAIIRISDVKTNFIFKNMFTETRMPYFLLAFVVYGMFGALFTKPHVFTSVYMSWFFDPGIDKDKSRYVNYPHTTNNMLITACTTIFYPFLGYLVLKKGGTTQLSKYQITILLQTFLFCTFHAIGAVIYAFMQYVTAPEFLIIVGQVAWQSSSGSVCLVYLTLNKTIKKSVAKMIFRSSINQNQVSAIAVENTLSYAVNFQI